MKKVAMLAVGMLFAMTGMITSAGAAGGKVGYVDTQVVFDKSKLGQKYQGIIREYYGSRKKILDIDADEIQKLQDDFKKQSAVMNEKARKEKEEAINRKITEFEKKRNEFNSEIQRKNDELSKEFDQVMSVILKEIAKKEKLDMVLNKSITVAPKTEMPVVLYADEGSNLTEKVIKEMDKKEEAK